MKNKNSARLLLSSFIAISLLTLSSCNQGPNLDQKILDKKSELAYLEKKLDSVKKSLNDGPVEAPESSLKSAPISSKFASIRNIDEDFFTTNSYNHGRPGMPKSQFKVGEKVYIWAKINAPQKETVEIRWIDSNGSIFSRKSYNISENTGSGYRIYSWKSSFPGPTGNFSVQLFNGQGERIAGTDFSVL